MASAASESMTFFGTHPEPYQVTERQFVMKLEGDDAIEPGATITVEDLAEQIVEFWQEQIGTPLPSPTTET